MASVELSTGEVDGPACPRATAWPGAGRARPSEILVPDRLFADELAPLTSRPARWRRRWRARARPSRRRGAAAAALRRRRPSTASAASRRAEIAALGLIAAHLETTQAGRLPLLRPPVRGRRADVMAIDPATRASLEIDRSLSGGREGSLLAAIDRTVTAPARGCWPPGCAGRCSTRRAIDARLDAVACFCERARRCARRCASACAGRRDMARALSRLALGRGGPRDLGGLRDGLAPARRLGAALAGRAAGALAASRGRPT